MASDSKQPFATPGAPPPSANAPQEAARADPLADASADPLSEELLTDDGDIERASRSLKAMSHPLRLKILCILGDEEVSVQDIVEHVGTSQSNISQHLAILRDKGILASRKDANRVFYRVSDSRTLQLIRLMREVFCHHGH
ncbi:MULTISPECIES: ArsR/SmtB family transcription factor [Thiorhodovibrio]|uniref:ArsR/SmtB family transcription factor n=1 Tax=Thiorhodovibrio TaxID=61593 RepID=UPI00237BCF7E|nr:MULTISPECIES: metalloregulator ArsR/SmtB family transcription factor [Thiorhodovibrio]WPL10568.1 Biofilm growth-associated repressor [Thiorhodovibrio litoralis]